MVPMVPMGTMGTRYLGASSMWAWAARDWKRVPADQDYLAPPSQLTSSHNHDSVLPFQIPKRFPLKTATDGARPTPWYCTRYQVGTRHV